MRSLLCASQSLASNSFSSSRLSRLGTHAIVAAATLLTATAASANDQFNDRAKRFSDAAMIDEARRATAADAAPAAAEQKSVGIGRSPEEQRALEAKREADLAKLMSRLKETQARVALRKPTAPPAERSPGDLPWSTTIAVAPFQDLAPEKRSGLGVRPRDNDQQGDTAETRGRATILIVMNPSANGRRPRAPDPILCVEYGCYISTGAQAPATFMTFSQATGPFGRIGRGAGACSNTDVCVFRSIDLGVAGSTPVQPVDLRFARPDRKYLRDVVADTSCRMISGRLSCSRPVRTEDYTMWVVPERIAANIGPEALSEATAARLQTAASADLPWLSR